MIVLAIPALAAAAYYTLALIAAARWKTAATPVATGAALPPISILKPIHGRDPHLYEALASHAVQDYPEFEILLGHNDPDDAALPDLQRIQRDFPKVRISIHATPTSAPNAKAGVLAALAKHARYPALLVNDSDIKVDADYLRRCATVLAQPNTGLVTCLYRASAESWPARAEALGIATEFAPSVLVARLLGVAEFALGSTMLFRVETLREIGGFEAIAEFLADDYQLGLHISRRGYRIRFAPSVVETALGQETFAQTWRHQVRWSRTIRVSRAAGYYGYVVTHATLWSAVAWAAGEPAIAAGTLALRMIAGIWAGSGILRDQNALRLCWLIPLRDLFGFAVWLAGLFGSTVVWRGQTLKLRADGRIVK